MTATHEDPKQNTQQDGGDSGDDLTERYEKLRAEVDEHLGDWRPK